MAYGDDIDALNPDHRWSFDNTYNDQVGSANATGSGTSFTTNPICEDVTYSMLTNALSDRAYLPSTADINNSAQTRKAVCGWFLVTSIQRPPERIYGEGDSTVSFAFIIGWGNNVIYEVDSNDFTLQIYSDTYLVENRAYHLCMIFEGNAYGNELRAYLDGVEQLTAQPVDRQPDYATLAARGIGEFGDSASTVGIGGTAILLEACTDGRYNQWATFDGANAVLTDTEVREELFEKGAIPDVIISTDTEANMQTALDVYADTVRGNAPLCIRIEPVSGGGNFSLTLDNITFNPLASIHVQYTGSDVLTLTNINGSDCSIISTTGTGSVTLKTRVSLTITAKDLVDGSNIVGARCYIEADTGGDLPVGTEMMNTTTNGVGVATVNFDYTSDQPVVGKVAKGSSSIFYEANSIGGSVTQDGLTQTVFLNRDE